MSRSAPLVVGAGPVGLGAALFLARGGMAPRVVERRAAPSEHSKALAINPRTLELLEPTGLTARLLALGAPIRGARWHRRGRVVAELPFDGIHPRYPFMLALSQARTEELLADALHAAGGAIERGVTLLGCRAADGGARAGTRAGTNAGVEATLEHADGRREVACVPWLLAADGARSTVREQLGIAFDGAAFAADWHLADAPLRTALPPDRAHLFLLPDGAFLFAIRVVDPALEEPRCAPLWRVVGNRADPLAQLAGAAPAEPTDAPLWTSSFRVSHRIAATLASGDAYLAGDAAHVHSPIGARGMNLGLEDARVFAALALAGRLGDYDRLRRRTDARVVRRVELVSRVVSAGSPLTRLARAFALPLAARLPPARARIARTVAGLDHELPRVAAAR